MDFIDYIELFCGATFILGLAVIVSATYVVSKNPQIVTAVAPLALA